MGDPDKSYFQDLAKQVKEGECMRLRIQLIKDESTKRQVFFARGLTGLMVWGKSLALDSH